MPRGIPLKKDSYVLSCYVVLSWSHKYLQVDPELFPESGQPDTIKLVVAFRSSANAPENYIMCPSSAG